MLRIAKTAIWGKRIYADAVLQIDPAPRGILSGIGLGLGFGLADFWNDGKLNGSILSQNSNNSSDNGPDDDASVSSNDNSGTGATPPEDDDDDDEYDEYDDDKRPTYQNNARDKNKPYANNPKNKQAHEALDKAAKEMGKRATKDDYQKFHREINREGFEKSQELLDAAREYYDYK